MKNLFRTLSIITALSLTAFVYAKAEEKKEAACCDKDKAACCKDGSCDHCKAEKAKAEKEAPKK